MEASGSFTSAKHMKDMASEISKWFTEHGSSELVRLPLTHPYSVTVPSPGTRCILYTTKPMSVAHALEDGLPSIQVVGRAGLPNEDDGEWLRTLTGDRIVLFLGDADPADLLIFVWLRSQMAISHVGVSDLLAQKLGVRLGDSLSIALADDEKTALSLLANLCPEYRALVGPHCEHSSIKGERSKLRRLSISPLAACRSKMRLPNSGTTRDGYAVER